MGRILRASAVDSLAQSTPGVSAFNLESSTGPRVALLTGGGDKPYALGLGQALMQQGIPLDFVGSDEVNAGFLHGHRGVKFLNLRGDQKPGVSRMEKVARVARYYLRLIRYAWSAEARVFHILWNNKLELFDRTILMLYYRVLGKKVVFTAHNVNAGKRDGNDSWVNRRSLKIQYGLCNHIFVHTEQMKRELIADFDVREQKVTVIPFGINNTNPETDLTRQEARQALGLSSNDKVMLFFGNIAPYKGVEYAVESLARLAQKDSGYRLVIAGAVKGCDDYWEQVLQLIGREGMRDRVVQKIGYIPDEKVEIYFKAADVLLLPYTHIFQSGVLFLGYSFGLPVIAADVGSLRDEIVEGFTGYVCGPGDPAKLGDAIERYFSSDMFRQLNQRRGQIRSFANERYSWAKVGEITSQVYLRA